METRARIELAYRDFADLRLTTWPSGQLLLSQKSFYSVERLGTVVNRNIEEGYGADI